MGIKIIIVVVVVVVVVVIFSFNMVKATPKPYKLLAYNISLVQQYTRKKRNIKNYHKTTVETKLYTVSQSYQQHRPY